MKINNNEFFVNETLETTLFGIYKSAFSYLIHQTNLKPFHIYVKPVFDKNHDFYLSHAH